MAIRDIYLIDGVRTAIGSLGGSLSEIPAAQLAAAATVELLKRTETEPGAVDELILGNVLQAGQGQNVARQAAMAARIPMERTAMTVNMVCGSGLRSVCLAAQAIALGDAGLIVAGGTENMSLAPYILPRARAGYRLGHAELPDTLVRDGLWDAFNDCHMGVTAENIARKYGISRAEQDAFAAASQQKAGAAIQAGRFAAEIVPIPIAQRKGPPVLFADDEYPRPGTTTEILAKLKPAFQADGTVTAGNASGINDAAACLLVAGEAHMRRCSRRPLARIVSYGWHGVNPAIMGIGPVPAIRQALDRAGWSVNDLDLIELNEAFAAQSLAVIRDLALEPAKINVNGGAIALGHPIGASGARILVTLLHEMKRRAARKGLAALCIGGGMGIAMCVEAA